MAEISSVVSWPDRVASFAPQFNPPQAELFKQLQVPYKIKIHMNMYTSRHFNMPALEEALSCPVAGHTPGWTCGMAYVAAEDQEGPVGPDPQI